MNKETEIFQDTQRLLKKSLDSVSLYDLKPGETFKDITEAWLEHPNTPEHLKKAIIKQAIRCYIFVYLSDGLNIKGYLTFPEKIDTPIPLIILLRGGNNLFCLPHPNEYSAQGYAVICTTLRGGVSEGKDEFGGDDVNDVKNLFNFLPALEKKLGIHFHPVNQYMIGLSRGGMQMFLTLERYPELQKKIRKIVSVTGMLNFVHALEERSDVKNAMINNFGLTEDDKGKDWIARRQPIRDLAAVSKSLPILIIQGTQDLRISKQEGYDLIDALRGNGHDVSYVEVEEGKHMLENRPDFISEIIQWMER